GPHLAGVDQRLEPLDPPPQLGAALAVEVVAQRPQLLQHVADVQREGRPGEQRLQLVPEPLGPVQHDLHQLARARAAAPLGRLRPRPAPRRLRAGKRATHSLSRPPSPPWCAAGAGAARHPPARPLALLPLAPWAPPRLAAAGLPPGPAAVPLAAAG